MSARKKGVALIGAGMVAQTHVAACLDARATLRLKGIMSRGQTSARALAQSAATAMGAPVLTYETVDEMAADPALDFVIIATPPNVRAALIEPLVRAGKHILLEKPVARSLAEANEVVALCRDAGVTLGIVFQHRVREASQAARALVRAGRLGQLGLAQFNVPWWRDQSYYDAQGRGTFARDGGGVLISQAIHTIDLGLSLTGPVRAVTAMAATTRFHRMEAEDFVVAGLEFANGAVGSLVASTASFPGAAESITLHFEAATLHLEAGVLRVSWRDGRVEQIGEEAATGGGADPMAFSHGWHQGIIENFAQVLDGTAPLFATGEDGLAAQAVIDATLQAARSGRKQLLNP